MHTPLNIKPINGCINYPYHPSVVFVHAGWNGHRYWMAQTPYSPTNMKPYKDRWELPCIHYSDDGIAWYPAMDYPVEDLTPEEINAKDYFSDPHLIMVGEEMQLYYRFSVLEHGDMKTNKTLLYRRTSHNGRDWSERELIADLRQKEDIEIWGKQIISPAIVWNNNQYYCWYVDASSYVDTRNIRLTISNDGIHWTKCFLCSLPTKSIIPWHLDVQYFDNHYQLLLFDINNQILAHYISNDAVSFYDGKVLLRPSYKLYSFCSESLYRACCVNIGSKKYVYVSGHNGLRSSIGLWETENFNKLIPKRGMPVCMYIIEYELFSKYWQVLKAIIRHKAKTIGDKIRRT